MLIPILALIAVSFITSCVLTFALVRIAPKLGFVDKPGGRKIHANPKPLGGGVAIFWAFALTHKTAESTIAKVYLSIEFIYDIELFR